MHLWPFKFIILNGEEGKLLGHVEIHTVISIVIDVWIDKFSVVMI